jgi:DNA-binding MarR family transcriptional regulator
VKEIAALSKMLSVVGKVDEFMQINELRALLYYYANPGQTVNSMQEVFGFDTATCSRVVARLSERAGPGGQKGHGYLYSIQDDSNIRRKLVYVTPKGQLFLEKVASAGAGA